jgi:hypothetical protein
MATRSVGLVDPDPFCVHGHADLDRLARTLVAQDMCVSPGGRMAGGDPGRWRRAPETCGPLLDPERTGPLLDLLCGHPDSEIDGSDRTVRMARDACTSVLIEHVDHVPAYAQSINRADERAPRS